MAKCPKCGNQLPDDAAFCGACGSPIANNANGKGGEIPTFTPPNQGAPIFTPPKNAAPTFQPPRGGGQHSGPVCYHHPTESATARCARCGKYICKDCAEAYGVSAGEYAGKCLCYDCCQEIVAQNVEELTRNKNKIKGQFILQIIGMVIGFIFGMSMGVESGDIGSGFVAGLICACIGGVFLSAMKAFFSLTWDVIKIAFSGNFGWLTVLSIIWNIIVIVFKCIWITVSNTIQYIIYLETLMNEGSELYNNSYAQAVRNNGEAAADAALRQATTRIAENGEIIRDFPNAAAA